MLWRDERMHNGTIFHCSPAQRGGVRLVGTWHHKVRWDDTGKEDTHDWAGERPARGPAALSERA